MDRIYVLIAACGLAAVGFITLWHRSGVVADRHELAMEFLERLKRYYESAGSDLESYSWLLQRSNRMQLQMGSNGVFDYRPPFESYIIRNYQLIVNMLPELRKELDRHDPLTHRPLAAQYANIMQESLVRHLGTIEDAHTSLARHLLNPVVWLREGVRSVTASPVLVLSWAGLIGDTTASRLTGNVLFRCIAGVVTIVTLASGAVTIVVGWERFAAIVAGWFS